MATKQKAFSSPSVLRSRTTQLLAGATASLLLTGCGSGLDEEDPAVYVRGVNLVADAPTLEFSLDDTAIANVAYSSSGTFSASHAGTRTLTLAALSAGELVDDDDDSNDEPIALAGSFGQVLNDGTDYTLIAYGTLAAPQVVAIAGTQDRSSVSDDQGALRLVHANPSLGTVAVYLTAPQAGIVAAQLIGTLGFGEATEYLELSLVRDADLIDTDSSLYADLTFSVVDPGSGNEIYRSDTVGLTEQTRTMFVIAPNSGPGPAPLRLVELTSGGTSAVFVAPDDEARVRIAHLSSDTPTLDVLNSSFQDLLATGVAFGGISADTSVRSDEVSLIAVPSDNYGAFVFLEEFAAAPGDSYTAYATGPLASVDAVVLTDDARSVPTRTGFRFLHAAGSLESQDVDIYVVPQGTALNFDDDDDVDDSVKAYAGVSYRNATSYTTLKGGVYDVFFTLADTTTTALGPVVLQADNGLVQTFSLMNAEDGSLELLPVIDSR